MPLTLAESPRLRRSPFYDATIRAGASAFTVYNHMLLPAAYAGMEAEYEALTTAVTVWDVAGERQVEFKGPDAARAVQLVTTRDVTKHRVGRARYVLVCSEGGGVLNDPVLLRLADDHFWMSLADRDILLWAQAWAAGRGLDVEITEPDVSPVQVQGPNSRELIRRAFGDAVADQRYFRFTRFTHAGVDLVVSRTGWSGEYGYEVFLTDSSRGEWLWDLLFAAGEGLGVTPAAPNQIRRIEGGILSSGSDMDDHVNPYELGLGRMVDLDVEEFAGRAALAEAAARPLERLLTGLFVAGPPLAVPCHLPVTHDGEPVGRVSSGACSPRFGTNVALGLVRSDLAEPEHGVVVHAEDGERAAVTAALPFVEATKD